MAALLDLFMHEQLLWRAPSSLADTGQTSGQDAAACMQYEEVGCQG